MNTSSIPDYPPPCLTRVLLQVILSPTSLIILMKHDSTPLDSLGLSVAAVGFNFDVLWLTRGALMAPLAVAAAQTLRPGLAKHCVRF